MKASKGDKIICSCGAPAGEFRRNVEDAQPITPDDITITVTTPPDGGYSCDVCKSAVAVISDGRWKVRTHKGWVA